MADRPPGRHAEGGSPVQGNRLHTTTSPSQQGPDAARVPRCGDRSLDLTGRALGILGVALAQWAARDDTRPDAEVRQAANTAMETIDQMLAGLHQLRARLVSGIRVSDDAAAARVDAMLAREAGQ